MWAPLWAVSVPDIMDIPFDGSRLPVQPKLDPFRHAITRSRSEAQCYRHAIPPAYATGFFPPPIGVSRTKKGSA